MTKKQYLEQILKETVDGGRVSEVERVYGAELPEVLKKIISNNEETIFLDDGVRILAFKETFWSKFNIIDEISFKKEKSIEALIK